MQIYTLFEAYKKKKIILFLYSIIYFRLKILYISFFIN